MQWKESSFNKREVFIKTVANFSFRRLTLFSIEPLKKGLFELFLFLFFFTLHADQLNVALGGYHFRLNNLLAFAGALTFFFRKPNFSIDKKLLLSLFLITLSVTISAWLSPYTKRCFLFFVWWLFVIICYFLFPYLLIKEEKEEKIFGIYLSSFLLVGLYAFFQALFGYFGLYDPFASQLLGERGVRPNAFAYEPSFYALYMTPFVMIANFHYLTDKAQPFFNFSRLTFFKILFLNGLFILSTSTSVIFAYLFFIFFVILYALWSQNKTLLKKTAKFTVFCSSVVVLACAMAPFLFKKFFLKFFYFGFMNHHSFHDRWIQIKNCWEIFKENPFFGIGLGAIPPYLYEAWASGLSSYSFLIDKSFYQMDVGHPLKYFEPSCVGVEILASQGLIGFSSYLIFLILFFSLVRKRIPYSYPMAIAGLVMLFVMQFNQGLFRTYIWAFFGLVWGYIEKKNDLATRWSPEGRDQGLLP